jgi:hypothetical protein
MPSRDMQSIDPNQPASPSRPDAPYALLGWLTLSLPIVVLVGWLGYQKYRVTARQRRIRKLERIWQLSPTEKRR